MKRLGYTRYVAQGRRLGHPHLQRDGTPGARRLLGIHINLPATIPPEVARRWHRRARAGGLSDKERAVSTR